MPHVGAIASTVLSQSCRCTSSCAIIAAVVHLIMLLMTCEETKKRRVRGVFDVHAKTCPDRRSAGISETCMMDGCLSRLCLQQHDIIMAPPRYRSLLELAAKRQQGTCRSCHRTSRLQFFQSQPIRTLQTSQKSRQDVAPSMEQMRKPFENRNKNTLYVKGSKKRLHHRRHEPRDRTMD